jgi:acetoin utilization protein AcuB
MTVEGIMSREVVTVSLDTSLMDIRKRLQEGGFHHMLVVEGDEPCGVISDRDVLRAISLFLDTYTEEHRDVQTLAQPASEVMRTELITVTPDTDIGDAANKLLDHDISSLPVVDEEELVGIVTTKDLLHHYTKNGE